MGRSIFVCPVETRAALSVAIEAVMRHNAAEMKPTGGRYSDDEFAALDPMRHATITALAQQMQAPGLSCEHGCMERWTRGEDIELTGCLVKFQGVDWLEVGNRGGGACSTTWLKANFPQCGWIGTEGKPGGFMEAPVSRSGGLLELLKNTPRDAH